VAPPLGIEKPETCVRADLYKMLLYEVGGHFQPHRDSEKADGMFGTLIVQLPSVYSGGAILVNHDGKTHKIDFTYTQGAESSFHFAAFYSDYEHEVLPLESGYRLALIYNLVFTGHGNIPTAPAASKTKDSLDELISDIARCAEEIDTNQILIPLEHMYSESSLRVRHLKGNDAHLLAVLLPYAVRGIIQIQLGTLEIHSNGSNCGDMDTEYSLKPLRVFDNAPDLPEDGFELKPLLRQAKKCSSDDLYCVHMRMSSLEPYDYSSNPTGNEGTEVERFYHTSALLIRAGKFKHDIFVDSADLAVSISRVMAYAARNTEQDWAEIDSMTTDLAKKKAFHADVSAMKQVLNFLLDAGKCSYQRVFLVRIDQTTHRFLNLFSKRSSTRSQHYGDSSNA
jgi:hypothetical protein